MAFVPSGRNISIRNVRLPYSDKDRAAKVWCVECQEGSVVSITPANHRPTEESGLGYFEVPTNAVQEVVEGGGGLMLPSCVSFLLDGFDRFRLLS